MTLFIFSQSEWGSRQINEETGLLVFEDFHWVNGIIFIPAVFAQKNTAGEGFPGVRQRQFKWLQGAFNGSMIFRGQLSHAGKIAGVIKLSVIGEQCLHRIRPVAVYRRDEFFIKGSKGGIIFAYTAIIASLFPVYSYISPDDGKIR